jgi:hypothetical protein
VSPGLRFSLFNDSVQSIYCQEPKSETEMLHGESEMDVCEGLGNQNCLQTSHLAFDHSVRRTEYSALALYYQCVWNVLPAAHQVTWYVKRL